MGEKKVIITICVQDAGNSFPVQQKLCLLVVIKVSVNEGIGMQSGVISKLSRFNFL